VREDNVEPGHLAAVTDRLTQEPPVMGDDLEIEAPDAPARVAAAALVRQELVLPISERDDRVFQHLEQAGRRARAPVGAEGEDRVTLHLLDLQGR